jgi:hypothetical protein
MKLFVGTQVSLPEMGPLCMSAVYPPKGEAKPEEVLLDSGAFSDGPQKRKSPLAALRRQMQWEIKGRELWGPDFRASHIVAYDRLMHHFEEDEEAKKRTAQTIWACKVLSMWRSDIKPRTLVMPVQGRTPEEQASCAESILKLMREEDWIGLGGWCQIGRWKSRYAELEATAETVLPMAAKKGIHHVHIFGVMWEPALEIIDREATKHNMTCSTDSSRPAMGIAWNNTGMFRESTSLQDQIECWRARLDQLTDQQQ